MDVTRRELMAGAAAAGLGGWPAKAQEVAPAVPLLGQITEELLADYPETALYLGIDRDARAALRPKLTDRSGAADRARAGRAQARLQQLKRVNRRALPAAAALDVDVTQAAYELAVEGWRTMPVGDVATLNTNQSFRNTPYLVSQLAGDYVDIPDLLETKHQVATTADADAFLLRLRAFATGLDAETERVRADAARGAVLPSFLLDITTGQLARMVAQPAAEWPLLTSFAAKCRAAGLGDHSEGAQQVVAREVQPALERQRAVLAGLRAGASEVPGVWARPGGEGWYRWLVKAGTTTGQTPDQLHELGLAQSRELNAQIDTLLRGQGLTQGSVGDRLIALSKRPDLLYANTDAGRAALLDYCRGRIADIRTRLPRAFGTLVPGHMEIRRVPPAIQDGAPNGYAGSGSLDGSQPGIYNLNLKDTTGWPRYSLPTICYHEGIPGHIWQGEYSYRLPLIRTLLAFNAYSEGWALYAEQLGSELGAYEGDPLGQIGFLQSMNFRACRLVVDTGLHARRWTFEQALRFFREQTGMPEGQLRSELERYCAMPGQACGYKMGHNEINRLRDRAKARPGYDLRAFDDKVVRSGNMPLTLLAQVMEG
jgi:uncharacterized protein (DUF885 family)